MFSRKIGSLKYTFEKGKLLTKECEIKTPFINPLKTKTTNIFNFLTIDIETFLDDEMNQIPYWICIYNGDESLKFYLDNYNSADEMLIAAIKAISIPKYNTYRVYAHNFSSFDGILLLRILNKCGFISPIIKDGKRLSINYKYSSGKSSEKKYSIKFMDSFLILPNSLRKLAISFKTDTQKGNFDVLKINKSNYKEFKDEAILYCIDDCKSLYEILFKFNDIIFNKFNICIKSYPPKDYYISNFC